MPVVQSPEPNRYHYDAIVVRVIDGDTLVLNLDLGMGLTIHNQVIRLYGINAPEMHGPAADAGQRAAHALEMLVRSVPLIVQTFKDKGDKYGRLLAKVYAKDALGLWTCVNDDMVVNGFAVVYAEK